MLLQICWRGHSCIFIPHLVTSQSPIFPRSVRWITKMTALSFKNSPTIVLQESAITTSQNSYSFLGRKIVTGFRTLRGGLVSVRETTEHETDLLVLNLGAFKSIQTLMIQRTLSAPVSPAVICPLDSRRTRCCVCIDLACIDMKALMIIGSWSKDSTKDASAPETDFGILEF